MELFDYNFPIIKNKFRDHLKYKSEVLDSIENFCRNVKKNDQDPTNKIIFQTDWNVPRYVNRDYFKIIEEFLLADLNETFDLIGLKDWELMNYWFQRYQQNDNHPWHNHKGAGFANVYFLEYNKNNPCTQFKKIGSDDIINIEVEEGDVITFPAIYWHRSPPNLDHNIKTIISFNLS